jgi:hypothetical protein
MISAEKVMNIKVVELIKFYNFYFSHFFFLTKWWYTLFTDRHISQELYDTI